MLEYITHLDELQIVSAMRRISDCTPSIPDSWGALKILKTWGGGVENLPITSTGAL